MEKQKIVQQTPNRKQKSENEQKTKIKNTLKYEITNTKVKRNKQGK